MNIQGCMKVVQVKMWAVVGHEPMGKRHLSMRVGRINRVLGWQDIQFAASSRNHSTKLLTSGREACLAG